MSKPSIELIEIVPVDAPPREVLEQAFGKHEGLEIYKSIVERVGIEPGEALGHGQRGVVYDLGAGRVLKLTEDAGEMEAAAIISRNPYSNLVRIYDAFVICDGQRGVGAIVREWVGSALDDLEDLKGFSDSLAMATMHAEDAFHDKIDEGLPADAALAGAVEDLVAYIEGIGIGPQQEKIERGIRAGIEALAARGIFGIDFAGRNIAVDDSGNAVIFDLGAVQVFKDAKLKRIGCPAGRVVSFESR